MMLCILLILFQQPIGLSQRPSHPPAAQQKGPNAESQKIGQGIQLVNKTQVTANPASHTSQTGSPDTIRIVSAPELSIARDSAAFFVSLLLAVTGIVGIIVAICTLRTIARQTTATENSADAALLNAKALINAERPWLLVDIGPDESNPRIHVLRAINKGRTPAEMVEGSCVCKYERVGQFVPEESVFAPFVAPIQTLTVGGDYFDICRVDPDYMAEQIKNPPWPMAVYLYGTILYWDTFTDRTKPGTAPYKTQWCVNYDYSTKRWYRSANKYTKQT